jgi:hypothetical protein
MVQQRKVCSKRRCVFSVEFQTHARLTPLIVASGRRSLLALYGRPSETEKRMNSWSGREQVRRAEENPRISVLDNVVKISCWVNRVLFTRTLGATRTHTIKYNLDISSSHRLASQTQWRCLPIFSTLYQNYWILYRRILDETCGSRMTVTPPEITLRLPYNGRCIGKHTPVSWPSRSPDIFFFGDIALRRWMLQRNCCIALMMAVPRTATLAGFSSESVNPCTHILGVYYNPNTKCYLLLLECNPTLLVSCVISWT